MFCLIHSVCTLPCWATDEFFDCHQALSKCIFDNDSLCEPQLFIHKTPRVSNRCSQQSTHIVYDKRDHCDVYTATNFKHCDLATQINTLCQVSVGPCVRMVPAMIGVESVSICSGSLLLSLGPELLPFGPVPFCTSTGMSTGMDMTFSVCQAAAKRAKTNTDGFDSLSGCFLLVRQLHDSM